MRLEIVMVIVDDMPFHHHINSSIIQDTLIYSIINLMYLDNYSSTNIKSIDIKQRCIYRVFI